MKLMELYQDKIMGAIRGLDRIRFRGTLRWLATQRGLGTFMNHTGVLLKDSSSWVHALTARIRDSPSVMRYFGRRHISRSGRIKGRAPQEVMTDGRKFYEGFRLKHWMNRNSIKVYNKSGSILRIETTINHTRDFKVFRSPADDAGRPASWQAMRKGVSDLHRRCELSDQCHERYAEALASAQVEEKLKEVVTPACNRIRKNGKSYRGLNP